MVSIGQGGGHNGNGGRGARNKALDIKSKLIRPSPGKSPLATLNKSLAPTPSTVINPDTTPVSRRIDELNVHPEDEDYDYDSAPTLDIKNKSNKPKLNKNKALTSSTVIKPASAPESGGSMFESETGEEEPKDKAKGKRLPGAHFKLSKNVCLFYLALHFQVKTTRRRRNRPSILEKK